MRKIVVIGAGNIGAIITFLLTRSGDYHVYLLDMHTNNFLQSWKLPNFNYIKFDATDKDALNHLFNQYAIDAVVSCLPYYCNTLIATAAAESNIHYFDLTEDVKTTE